MRTLLLAAATLATGAPAAAESLRFCDRATVLTAREQDRLLQFAAIARAELERSGDAIALVARSGLDLRRFNVRYSHAGISLRASPNTPWSVRQLYYACDERRPRLFDQGLAGFVSGTDDPTIGYLSIVSLPPDAAADVERAALDTPRALALVAATYSANAHPFSLRYQNCNQWLIELLASAWGATGDGERPRAAAQAWLREQGYAPPPVEVGSHLLMFAAAFVPWVRLDDHSEADRFALRIQTSLPASIEAFVQQRLPAARRVELCHDARQVVIRRGWQPLADGCLPAPGDRVVAFD